MTHHKPGTRPFRGPLASPYRQMTIGEMAAIARYGPTLSHEDREPIPLSAVINLIDQLRVCTTCGWTEQIHTKDERTRGVLQCCPQWTRDL